MSTTAKSLVAIICASICLGCTPFDFSTERAVQVNREQLLHIAEQGTQDHLYYAGSDWSYHYLVDTRKDHESAYKIEHKQLKLKDTFERDEDSPYVVYPHVIEGKKIGHRPREIAPVTGSDE